MTSAVEAGHHERFGYVSQVFARWKSSLADIWMPPAQSRLLLKAKLLRSLSLQSLNSLISTNEGGDDLPSPTTTTTGFSTEDLHQLNHGFGIRQLSLAGPLNSGFRIQKDLSSSSVGSLVSLAANGLAADYRNIEASSCSPTVPLGGLSMFDASSGTIAHGGHDRDTRCLRQRLHQQGAGGSAGTEAEYGHRYADYLTPADDRDTQGDFDQQQQPAVSKISTGEEIHVADTADSHPHREETSIPAASRRAAFDGAATTNHSQSVKRRIDASRYVALIDSVLPEAVSKELDKMYMEPRFGRRLFKSSCFLAIPICVSGALGVWDCAMVSLAVFLTSLNHWRMPRVGMRRLVDVVVVQLALFYHLYLTVYEADRLSGLWWISCCVTGMSCYVTGRLHGNRGNHDLASAWHVSLHVVGMIGNMGLYPRLRACRAEAAKFSLLGDGGSSSLEVHHSVSSQTRLLFWLLTFCLLAIAAASWHLEAVFPVIGDEDFYTDDPLLNLASVQLSESASRSADVRNNALREPAPCDALNVDVPVPRRQAHRARCSAHSLVEAMK